MYKKDDIVVCLPGFNTRDKSNNNLGVGAGYKDGRIYCLGSNTNDNIVWPIKDIEAESLPNGVYNQGIRIATEHEIKYYKEGVRYLKDVPAPELTYEIF